MVRRRPLSLLVVVAIAALGSAVATQYLAHAFGNPPELGTPLASVGGWPVYPPLSWYSWCRQWGHFAPKTFGIALAIAIAGAAVAVGVGVAVRGAKPLPKPTGAFGTARWATLPELASARLLSERGIVLGQTAEAEFDQLTDGTWRMTRLGKLIRYDGDGHTLVFARTRGGKTVTAVIPTLLSYTAGSVLIHDPKGENWEKTSGWRRLFSHCLRIEPTAPHSVRFNPLLEVRPSPLDVRDAQNIAEIIVNPDQMTDEQRDHWKLTGHAFLVGVILHVLYAGEDKSLRGVLHALTNPDQTLYELLQEMLHTQHLASGPHPAVAGAARAMLNRSEKERSGVNSTAESFLAIYRDAIIAENTATSDFTIADLMCAERPISLYFIVPQSDQERCRAVVRLLINVFGRRLTEHLDHVDCGPSATAKSSKSTRRAGHGLLERFCPSIVRLYRRAIEPAAIAIRLTRALRQHIAGTRPVTLAINPDGSFAGSPSAVDLKHTRDLLPKRRELLWLIDELPMLKRIPFIGDGISSVAQYRHRFFLIAQSLKQLDEAYGANNSILDNCENRVTYGTTCDQTATRISRLLGTQSLMRTQISVSKRGGPLSSQQVSESYQEYGRPLKTVDELLTQPFPEAIVLGGTCRPYLGRKLLYYQDPRFMGRAVDRARGLNLPPEAPRQQRAELPPQRRPSHWLQRVPVARAQPEKTDQPSCAAEGEIPSSTDAAVAAQPEARPPSGDYFAPTRHFEDILGPQSAPGASDGEAQPAQQVP